MNWDERNKALVVWPSYPPRRRFWRMQRSSEMRWWSIAGKLQYRGLIDPEGKNAMILEATERYASALDGQGQGTLSFSRSKKSPPRRADTKSEKGS